MLGYTLRPMQHRQIDPTQLTATLVAAFSLILPKSLCYKLEYKVGAATFHEKGQADRFLFHVSFNLLFAPKNSNS